MSAQSMPPDVAEAMVEFVRARRKEDWEIAMDAATTPWRGTGDLAGFRLAAAGQEMAHVLRHPPSRVIADVAVVEQVLGMWLVLHRAPARRDFITAASESAWDGLSSKPLVDEVMRFAIRVEKTALADVLLTVIAGYAAVHSGHPDFDERWRAA